MGAQLNRTLRSSGANVSTSVGEVVASQTSGEILAFDALYTGTTTRSGVLDRVRPAVLPHSVRGRVLAPHFVGVCFWYCIRRSLVTVLYGPASEPLRYKCSIVSLSAVSGDRSTITCLTSPGTGANNTFTVRCIGPVIASDWCLWSMRRVAKHVVCWVCLS